MAAVAHRFDRQYEVVRSSKDQRSAARKDRDRILYAPEFVRLVGITQVASPTERVPVHNRLTHSFKVAQVGRSVAERLLLQYPGLGDAYLDPDVVEAACLAHDLGHPPFGHNTERELDTLLVGRQRRPDGVIWEPAKEGFNGNAQSFRVLCRLSIKDIDEDALGLHLTRATLSATLKYPWPYPERRTPNGGWGWYDDDGEDAIFAQALVPEAMRRRPTLEAELMDWADDVTYGVHDVEDFFRAGLVPLERVFKEGELERDIFTASLRAADKVPRDRIILTLNSFVGYPLRAFTGSRSDRALLRAFTTPLIDDFVRGPSVDWTSQGVSYPRLRIPEEIRHRVSVLKHLTTHYVIERPSVLTQRYGQRHLVRTLFDILMTAALNVDQADLTVFPIADRERIERLKNPGSAVVKRHVADCIASMSEDQVVQTYQRLTGQTLGSVVDPVL